jgi:hypothetical protein
MVNLVRPKCESKVTQLLPARDFLGLSPRPGINTEFIKWIPKGGGATSGPPRHVRQSHSFGSSHPHTVYHCICETVILNYKGGNSIFMRVPFFRHITLSSCQRYNYSATVCRPVGPKYVGRNPLSIKDATICIIIYKRNSRRAGTDCEARYWSNAV